MNIHRITYNPKTNSCSLYFIGCNFHCKCCYWKKIYPKVDLKALTLLNLKRVVEILKPVSPKTVILISGDPVKNREFLILPRALYQEFGCEVRLMTNGHILPSLEGLAHVSLSIKALNDELHRAYTNKSNKTALRNLRVIHERGVGLSLSSVLIPGLIDENEIRSVARFISRIDRNIPYRIIGYMPVNGYGYRRPEYGELEELADSIRYDLNEVIFSDPVPQDYTGIIDLFTNNLQR